MKRLLIPLALLALSAACSEKISADDPRNDPHLSDPVEIPSNGGVLSEPFSQSTPSNGVDYSKNKCYVVSFTVDVPSASVDFTKVQHVRMDIPYKLIATSNKNNTNALRGISLQGGVRIKGGVKLNGDTQIAGTLFLRHRENGVPYSESEFSRDFYSDNISAMELGLAKSMYFELIGEDNNRRGSTFYMHWDSDIVIEEEWKTATIEFYIGARTARWVSIHEGTGYETREFQETQIEFLRNDFSCVIENTRRPRLDQPSEKTSAK